MTATGNKIRPRWLIPLLQLTFYEEHDVCRIPGHKWKTIFCKKCIDGPLCRKCCTKSHKGHDFLQVCRASHAAAVPKDEAEKCLDVYFIQPFSFNSRNIFFLDARGKNLLPSSPKCVTCQGHIMKSDFKFCSIACKVKFILETSGDHEDEHLSYSMLPSSDIQEVEVQPPKRHRRKGIPRRSPLQ